MGRREDKKQATRDAIIKAAAVLFDKHEYDAVTVEEIAAMARIGKGTVYNYFPSKEDIAAALANAVFQEGLPVVDKLLSGGATALDILKTLFLAGAAWAEQNPRLAQVTLSNVLRRVFTKTEGREQIAGYGSLFALILRMVEIGQAAGQIRRDTNAPEMARTLALLHAQTLWFWTAVQEEAPSECMIRALQNWLEGAESRV